MASANSFNIQTMAVESKLVDIRYFPHGENETLLIVRSWPNLIVVALPIRKSESISISTVNMRKGKMIVNRITDDTNYFI